MRRLLSFIVAAVAVTALAGCASLDGYAAKVNGSRIARDELESELEAILANEKYLDRVDQGAPGQAGGRVRGAGNGTFTTTFVAALLDRRISLELIHQEVRRRNLVPTVEQRQAARQQVMGLLGGKELFEGFPKSYRDKLVAQFAEVFALQEALGPPKVEPAEVAEFYEENRAVFDRTCVRHILVDTQEKAAAIKARILAGEDFAAIAAAESADRGQGGEGEGGSATKGGSLGCLPSGGLVPEFQEAMDALQPGQVSDPVKTQFGFHIIEVTDRQSLSLEEAAPEIRRRLQSQATSPVAEFVDRAVRRAEIEVNPRYGTFVKSGQNPGVRPPKEPKTDVTAPVTAPLPVPGR